MSGGGGKTSTSTSQVTIPQDVLNRYNSVNQTAEQAASQPFQQYSTDPNAFVAPLNSTQQSGIANTNSAVGMVQPYVDSATGYLTDAQSLGSGMVGSAQTALLNAKNAANGYNTQAGGLYNSAYSGAQPYNQTAGGLIGQGLASAQPLNQQAQSGYTSALSGAQPYNQAATGLAMAGASAVNPSALDSSAINQYMSPYLSQVLGSTQAMLNQQNQQAMSGQTGNAIQNGAFGGDRAGIAAANLAQQQQTANAQIYSGILNDAYNNALGTAQQQQGVGLSAGQANRAAQQQGASQLASIGNQQYTQGTGTAAGLAGLGNQEYAQGLGASQAVQGLGNQVFNQGSTTGQNVQGLGNQVFGQGLQTSQQEAALANQMYGMGSNTASQLAGLGTTAQNAQLAGANAQMSAGSQAQQTQQAGLTALYNQFLQQQSYPFQVAQFLANIAEGTGSLSGSTTTTTQPGGFFSDKRLKEDVKKIGKTFDGQPIYSFKYKGDDRTTMGLMAQDVEKRHPEAVGLAAGYKTVDYGKATGDAAKRGKFAAGGSTDYAPYSANGLYGSESGGAPRGGLSYVPLATLPVNGLMVAHPVAADKSPMEQAKEIADIGADVSKAADSKTGQKAISWAKGLFHDNDDSANDNDFNTGGLARPKRYATGGMPYDQQTGLDIPDDKPTAKLNTPDTPSGKSGSDAEDAVKMALDVAKIAAMFKKGGRVAKAGGGEADDIIDEAYGANELQGGDGSSKAWPFGTIETTKDRYGVDHKSWNPWGPKSPPDVDVGKSMSDMLEAPGRLSSGLSQAMFDKLKPSDAGVASGVAAPTPAPVKRRPAGLVGNSQASQSPPDLSGTPMDVQTAPAPQGLGALNPAPSGNADLQGGLAGDYIPEKEGLGDKVKHIAGNIGDALGGYGKDLKSGDVPAWVSLLSGIGAMGTAPTVHPGVALAAGLTGGTQAYMKAKQTQAELAQKSAETSRTQAMTNIANRPAPSEGYTWVPGPGPHGEAVVGPDGKSVWHRVMNVNATDYGSGPSTGAAAGAGAPVSAPTQHMGIGPSESTDQAMAHLYNIDPTRPAVANRERVLAMNPELAPLDAAANQKVQDRIGNLQDVENSRRQTVQLMQAYASLPKTGPLAQGHGSAQRALWANIATTAEQMAGITPDPTMADATSANQVLGKLKAFMGPAMAGQYGEKAASVAHSISSVIPSGDMTPKAAAEISAALLVQPQMQADLANYKDQYASRYGVMVGVEPAFAKDTGAMYAADQQALSKFMQNSHFGEALADLQSADPAKRAAAARTVDKAYKRNISRYFVGGQ